MPCSASRARRRWTADDLCHDQSVFEIVGREEELGSLYAFIGDAGGPLAALVLEGEAGIGKSTLWLAGLEHARTRGLRVLPHDRPKPSSASLT